MTRAFSVTGEKALFSGKVPIAMGNLMVASNGVPRTSASNWKQNNNKIINPRVLKSPKGIVLNQEGSRSIGFVDT